MGTIYGYCRVSRAQQNIERQVRNIKEAYPTAEIVKDIHSRMNFDERKYWNILMKKIRKGDAIVFDSVSRMSGDKVEGVQKYMELFDKGVELIFLNEPTINTAVYRNALSNQIPMTGTNADLILEGVNRFLVAVAKEQIEIAYATSEKEVLDLRKRTRGGIETARQAGKQIGRPAGRTYETKKSVKMKENMRKMLKEFDGNMTSTECQQILSISKTTFYKYREQLRNERMMKTLEEKEE